MSLTAADQERLARIVRLARALESAWPVADRQAKHDLSANAVFEQLKKEIAACDRCESEDLRRLAPSTQHLHDELSLAHFYAQIVPFERLLGRALRDDEFLVEEGDREVRKREPLPLKLIAENLRSAFNVGALFRTGECLGIAEIWLCGYTPGPDDEKTARTAMGTDSSVPWRRADRARTACEALRAQGYRVIALETTAGAEDLTVIEFGAQPVAFVVGNERFGLEAETLAACDSVCRIPVRGIKNSLNVGIAFGIAAYEFMRQHERRVR